MLAFKRKETINIQRLSSCDKHFLLSSYNPCFHASLIIFLWPKFFFRTKIILCLFCHILLSQKSKKRKSSKILIVDLGSFFMKKTRTRDADIIFLNLGALIGLCFMFNIKLY